jgi:hypothetical protein
LWISKKAKRFFTHKRRKTLRFHISNHSTEANKSSTNEIQSCHLLTQSCRRSKSKFLQSSSAFSRDNPFLHASTMTTLITAIVTARKRGVFLPESLTNLVHRLDLSEVENADLQHDEPNLQTNEIDITHFVYTEKKRSLRWVYVCKCFLS